MLTLSSDILYILITEQYISRRLMFLFNVYRQNFTVDSSSRSVTGSGFLGNTLYNITIAVNVKYPGLQSTPSQVFTPEGSKYICY